MAPGCAHLVVWAAGTLLLGTRTQGRAAWLRDMWVKDRARALRDGGAYGKSLYSSQIAP